MTIRSRITFWYTGVLCASILLMAGILYFELVYEPRKFKEAGRPEQPVEEEILEVLILYGVPTMLATLLGGWLLLKKTLAPLEQLTEAADQIQAETLDAPLPRSGNGDEVDRLSEVLNATTQRLADSFQRIREFTLYASHELKTPLTVIRNELETALSDEDLSKREHDRNASLLEEIERLTHIVDSLTFLTRADTGQLQLKLAPLQLDDLVQESVEDIQVLAEQDGIEARLLDCHPATVQGDRQRLRQLLLILADNATKYNKPQGRVTLSLHTEGQQAILTMANTGPGIPASMMGRLFERFFRGDASHSHQIDGCGLGLTIAHWIVKAHHGDIQVRSKADEWTTVTVTLPLMNPAPNPVASRTGKK